jgi:hypothetical protein
VPALVPPSLLAHPLTEARELPFSPAVAAVVSACAVAAVALYWRGAPAPGRPRELRPVDSWAGGLGAGAVAGRVLGVALLVVAVVAGRVGSPEELHNIAPALVVGAGWPLLVLGSALLGPVWRWLDPWDGVARTMERSNGTEDTETVWAAVVPATLWGWYLSAYADALSPRSIGLALGVYSIVTVAGCLAIGRARVLSGVEVFGLLFGWAARLPRRLLPAWSPPRGTEVVLGVLGGGVLFGAVRQSSLWGGLNVAEGAWAYAAVGVAALAALFAALLWFLERWASRRGVGGSVAAAVVPVVVAVVVAVGMGRGPENRLYVSVLLLGRLVSDPFGFGWDLLGTADLLIGPSPFGPLGRAWIQLGLLVAGGAVGGLVLARRTGAAARLPGTIAIGAMVGASTLVLATF